MRIESDRLRSEVKRLNEANKRLSEEQQAPAIPETKANPFESERAELTKKIESLKADNKRLREEKLVGAEVALNAKKWHQVEVGGTTIDFKENPLAAGALAMVVLLTFYVIA